MTTTTTPTTTLPRRPVSPPAAVRRSVLIACTLAAQCIGGPMLACRMLYILPNPWITWLLLAAVLLVTDALLVAIILLFYGRPRSAGL